MCKLCKFSHQQNIADDTKKVAWLAQILLQLYVMSAIFLVDVKINLNRLNLLTTFTHLIMIDALLRAAKYLHVYVCS